eukprot:2391925-Rhodomonas_salina.2
MRCPVLSERKGLRACYAMSGTDIAYGATRVPPSLMRTSTVRAKSNAIPGIYGKLPPYSLGGQRTGVSRVLCCYALCGTAAPRVLCCYACCPVLRQRLRDYVSGTDL